MTRPIIQAKLLGRFGNQLHQYAACRKYAELHNAVLETPDWVGRRIFGLTEPDFSCELPEVNDGGCGCPPALRWGQVNIRLGGYFQFQTWIALLCKQELQSWLRVDPMLAAVCAPSKRPRIAVHRRQGDYVGHPLYCNVRRASYLRCLEKILPRYGFADDEVVWVEEEHPRVVTGIPPELSFLPDFMTLMRAAVLVRANSTFSWWAGALGNGHVYAPVVEDRVGEHDVVFTRGNWPRCADSSRVGVKVTDLHLPSRDDV